MSRGASILARALGACAPSPRIPALGLIAGCALGPARCPTSSRARRRLTSSCALSLVAALAVWARRADALRVVAPSWPRRSSAGGVLLAARAWQRRVAAAAARGVRAIAREQRADAVAGRPAPLGRRGVRRVVEGVLRADASPTGDAASSLSVERRSAGRAQAGCGRNPVDGGVLLTVVGALARRARRTSGAPGGASRTAGAAPAPVAVSRSRRARPGAARSRGAARAGRHGQERRARRGGRARASRRRSGGAALRAFARRAIGDAVGRWSAQSAAIVTAIVIGDRAGLDDDVAAPAAGSRDVSRDRDLRRQHRDSRRAHAGGVPVAGVLGRAAMLSADRRPRRRTAISSAAARRSIARR